ncbi:hypothetical protein M404DRAFT_426694 [Pisolithus tinctorius Marx 270]|uniref:Uncharacterized protein n=1 Tax=Pisolithus tinctorius Marx 270 TaxID=870435 RepID=A0A0C3P1U9_PISTI|nr:hypothetical protein M404DRAFT_426694 [Pisolithus tinctorius Marx 270]
MNAWSVPRPTCSYHLVISFKVGTRARLWYRLPFSFAGRMVLVPVVLASLHASLYDFSEPSNQAVGALLNDIGWWFTGRT